MRRTFFFIFTLFLVSVVGCRASREVQTTQQRHYSSNIDVEAHRLDSLWSLLVERYHVHVEFFNPNEVRQPNTDTTGSPLSLTKATQQGSAPRSTKTADGLGLGPSRGGIGGLGAVKSIEITTERGTSTGSVTAVDSVVDHKIVNNEVRQTEKASEARQDNGTVIGVAIVLAVGLIVYLLLKEFLKP